MRCYQLKRCLKESGDASVASMKDLMAVFISLPTTGMEGVSHVGEMTASCVLFHCGNFSDKQQQEDELIDVLILCFIPLFVNIVQ